jgi:quinol monooxygenase YgiN
MVMTMLEGQVAPDRVADLERAYREAVEDVPSGILETYLVRDTRRPSFYRILTVWSDQAALDAMRASGATPRGIQVFQAAGAGPEVSLLDVVINWRRS